MTALPGNTHRTDTVQPVVKRFSAAEFGKLAADWSDLLARADCNRLFLGWEWQYSWWETWGDTPGYELVLVGCYRAGQLVALAPLYTSLLRAARMPGLRRLQFVGNAWQSRATVRTEYLEFILDRSCAQECFNAIWTYLRRAVSWDDLVLCDCPSGSDFHRRVCECCAADGNTLIERAVDRGVRVDTGGDFNHYLDSLGRSTRSKIRRDRARLSGETALATLAYPVSDPNSFFTTLNDFHRQRWGKPCFAADSLGFHLRLLARSGPALRPVLEGLTADGEVVSMLYNIAADGCLYNIQSGFSEQRFAPVALGTVHLVRAIGQAHADPELHGFDLLAGAGRHTFYKSHFRGRLTRFCTLQVTGSRWLALALRSYLKYRPGFRRLRKRLQPVAGQPPPARVVITGADTITGLNTARALRDLHVQVTGIANDLAAPACRSRYWHELQAAGEADYPDVLLAIGRRYRDEHGQKPVLLVTQDALVIEVTRRRAAFERYFRMLMPTQVVTDTLMDKTRFHTWAHEHDCRVPDSIIIGSYRELEQARDVLRFPFIFKPLVRTGEWDRTHPRDKFIMLEDGTGLDRLLEDGRLFEYAPRYLLQQWIPGDDSNVCFCLFLFDWNGIEVAALPGRKIFQWPVAGGSTAVCVDLVDAGLLALSRSIMTASGVVGLCSIEFKRHAETGDYYITEPTVGRNDLQSYIANVAGINLTRRYVEYLLDLPGLVQHSQQAACWVDELSLLRLLRSRKYGAILAQLRAGLRGRRRGFAWSDLRDPAPGLHLLKALLKSQVGR